MQDFVQLLWNTEGNRTLFCASINIVLCYIMLVWKRLNSSKCLDNDCNKILHGLEPRKDRFQTEDKLYIFSVFPKETLSLEIVYVCCVFVYLVIRLR